MPKEAVVLILDANATMTARVVADTSVVNESDPSPSTSTSSTSNTSNTRFECAKEAAIAIISDLMVRSKTNEVTVLVLHTEETHNYFYEKDDKENDDKDDDDKDDDEDESNPHHDCPFPNITEISGNGEIMDIRQPLPNLLRKIKNLQPNTISTSRKSLCSKGGGDFVSGIVYAADALHRRTSGKKYIRRIVLLTDAEHKIGSSNDTDTDSDTDDDDEMHQNTSSQRLLVALDSLRAMQCRIQVVGMNFEHAADFDAPANKPSKIKVETMDEGEENNDVKGKNDRGFVYNAKEIKGMLEKVLGSRVIQNPSKRKVIVEIAPNIVLEDAKFYLLISKSGSTPLKKRLVMVDEKNGEPRTNELGDEMLQDYDTSIYHYNAEDGEGDEELLFNRLSYAYRFGSDLIPFSPLDEAGLTQRSPVKLTILGYTQKQIPQYMRLSPPYVLTGNESRRCCAAISALARGLQRTKRTAIATFVKSKDKDPILCGLFPLENGDKPLRLMMMQLPFSADARIPWIEQKKEEEKNPQTESICDELIDNLMLPDDALDYEHMPNHKIRSFYKTVVKRVLEDKCDVVSTRIVNGMDPMDTPNKIKEKAKPAVLNFYESFDLKKVQADTGKENVLSMIREGVGVEWGSIFSVVEKF
ncbi:SPOC domain-like protein [Fragilariopsis cylindrus CCMP1102]|uniref:SPOC domain-like protein n=1 Tax=Fragilariopsis cylindrus CCMP1102 TaxID=635003 RepID=A0A1E7FAZ6_9STRA|nr:SPOC domain-like protein [Fragilariopsis cylindrus CCMP1102]|eukprot:OEU15360.1 SPOC domain-like protein [Fragilariopsis cylindrus CCMP1102]